MRQQLKNPLWFISALLPLSAIGGLTAILSTFSAYTPDMQAKILASAGSYTTLLIMGTLQAVIITVICGFIGYLLAEQLGLMRPFTFAKQPLQRTVWITAVCGLLFSLDYWVFGRLVPQIAELNATQTSALSFLTGIFYGGIVEEVLMRLFLMSLFSWLLWKVFVQKHAKDAIPKTVFMAANLLAATLFAAGHLPATLSIFGELTPLLVFRCFLLNGALGLVFGQLYTYYGIHYAMLSHAGIHLIAKLSWLIFV